MRPEIARRNGYADDPHTRDERRYDQQDDDAAAVRRMVA
jgi:hypothetical protein